MRSYMDEITPPPLEVAPIHASAGFGIRFVARLVDFVFSSLLGLFTGFFAGIVLGILQHLGHMPENWMELINQKAYWPYLFGIFGTVAYHWFAEGIGGTTIGKLCCGLSVIQVDGRPCEFFAGFKRSLAYLMDALFFGAVGYSSMKESLRQQRYGDVWAETMVVKTSGFTPSPKPSVVKIIAGIVLGSVLLMACQTAQLLAPLLAA